MSDKYQHVKKHQNNGMIKNGIVQMGCHRYGDLTENINLLGLGRLGPVALGGPVPPALFSEGSSLFLDSFSALNFSSNP